MVKYKFCLKYKDTSKSLNEVIIEGLKIELKRKLNIISNCSYSLMDGNH